MDKLILFLMFFTIANSAYMTEKQTEVIDDILVLNSDGSFTEVDGYDGPGEEDAKNDGVEREWNTYDEWELEPASWEPENEDTNATVMNSTERKINKYLNESFRRVEERRKKEILKEKSEDVDKKYNERPMEIEMLLKKGEADKPLNNEEVSENDEIEQKDENEDSNTESDEDYSENNKNNV